MSCNAKLARWRALAAAQLVLDELEGHKVFREGFYVLSDEEICKLNDRLADLLEEAIIKWDLSS